MVTAAPEVSGRLRHFQRTHQIVIGLAVRDENAQGDAAYLSIRALNRSPKQVAACGSIGPCRHGQDPRLPCARLHGQGPQIGRACSAL